MINFQELQLEINEKYSFVGIARRDLQLILCLPKGFDITLFTTYDSKRDLFFLFYRILSNFKEICLQKGYLQFDTDIRTQDRDGVIRNQGSIQKISLPDVEIEENILYSKLDLIGSILNAYDEPKILSLVCRLGKSEEIDYSKLHLFLHRGVYLDNGSAYIDAMTLPRQIVHYQPTDIVGMYCYILVEVKQQLHEEVSGEVAALAEQFKHRYIGAEFGLFHEEYSSQTVDSLKDALELIDRNTALKDADYWYFYEAIELFLHGELSQVDEGEIWGIKNFHNVWESMCLTYLAKTVSPEYILHLDTTFLFNHVVTLTNSNTKILDLANVFMINGSRLVPDAVVFYTGFNKWSLKVKNTYYLRKDVKRGIVWDDYGYKTAFYCKLFDSSEEVWLRIAYKNQDTGAEHTFDELAKFYETQGDRLIINSQLPSNFYSFWNKGLENLSLQLLNRMFNFNHVFYVALKNSIFTASKFREFLLNELDANDFNSNVFTSSIFRNYNVTQITNMFNDFLKGLIHLKIIDIKYLQQKHFYDANNRRYLKEKSIRKQFAYEHLLQQFIGKNHDFNSLEIKSSFWLPSWQDDCRVITKVEPEYLDEYIGLENVNFAAIVDSYFD